MRPNLSTCLEGLRSTTKYLSTVGVATEDSNWRPSVYRLSQTCHRWHQGAQSTDGMSSRREIPWCFALPFIRCVLCYRASYLKICRMVAMFSLA